MCDTFVALPDVTVDGDVIFGKNSDRPQGEIQEVVTIPTSEYTNNNQLECTYITIPQVPKTLAVILSKPKWMWGAEMGANECGVVIGNEAVWTIEPYHNTGLLGMDLLRLGLERGRTAKEALNVMTKLLVTYGQGGYCAEFSTLNYHNSFLIADEKEAWVLETAGVYWVAEQITKGVRSISNNLTIRNKGDLQHDEVVEYATTMGFCCKKQNFDFAKIFSDGDVEDDCSPYTREGRVRQLCQRNKNQFSIETAQLILRDHEGSICMHGEFETTGSQISSLSTTNCEHWFINQPFPCQQTYHKYDFKRNL